MQRDLTAGLSQFLPSFVPRLWAKPSPVAELTLDSYRHILYLRLQSGAVQVLRLPVSTGVRIQCFIHELLSSIPAAQVYLQPDHDPAAAGVRPGPNRPGGQPQARCRCARLHDAGALSCRYMLHH